MRGRPDAHTAAAYATTVIVSLVSIGWTVSSGQSKPRDDRCLRPSGVRPAGFFMRGAKRADVDGDRAADEIAVVGRVRNRVGCRFFLVVRLARGRTLTRRLPEATITPGDAAREIPWPRLFGTAFADAQRGSEALVVVEQGVATATLRLYGWSRGTVASLTADARPADFNVGLGNWPAGVDCLSRTRLVSSFAERADPGWEVTRRLYRIGYGTFKRLRTETRSMKDLRRLPEFREEGLAFSACR